MPTIKMRSQQQNSIAPQAVAAAVFLVVVILLGGASRSDVLSLPFLRAFAAAAFVMAMLLAWGLVRLVRASVRGSSTNTTAQMTIDDLTLFRSVTESPTSRGASAADSAL